MRSRISGELQKVHFTDGELVQRDQLLFTIDPRPYQAALDQAKANLQRDEASLKDAQVKARRYESMVKRDFVSQQQYDDVMTNVSTYTAAVKADQAAVKNAELNLAYCYVRAPFAGRTGRVLVDAGNQVDTGSQSSALTVINQVKPAYVEFSIPERDLPTLRKYMGKDPLKVRALPAGEAGDGAMGELTFLDNQVDADTGTILLRGTFANQDLQLWPGMFVDVVLTLTEESGRVVVPNAAVRQGPQGLVVFAVGAEGKVQVRPVTQERVEGARTVLSQGVEPGEKVVVDGHLILYPGAAVIPREVPANQESLDAMTKGKGEGKAASAGQGGGGKGK